MHERREGEPCPVCATPLQRRRSTFRTISGDIAYCARCSSAYELAVDEDPIIAATPPGLAPA